MRLLWPWLCPCLLLNTAAGGPELSAGRIVNAASHSAGQIAPGEIVVLYPSNAGPATLAGAQLDSDGRVATLLGETRVFFDGIAAPVAYTVRGEVGAIVPYEISSRKTTEVSIEYQGRRSPPVTVPVTGSAPALFTLDSSGKGQAAMLNETGCCNSARNPAVRGGIAILYATGEGRTVPPGVTGSVSVHSRVADYPAPQLPVEVTVGGEKAEILYAAGAPHAIAGLLQVNFRVPPRAPLGDAVPIFLTVGASRSPDGVTMAIRSPVQTVLVIEPDPAARQWLGSILASAGYRVCAARSGREALAQAGRRPIDAVLTSLALPEQERLEAMRAIRAERPRLAIIATAAALGPAALRAADLLGAQAILARPITARSLVRRLRELLRPRPVPYAVDAMHPAFPWMRGVAR